MWNTKQKLKSLSQFCDSFDIIYEYNLFSALKAFLLLTDATFDSKAFFWLPDIHRKFMYTEFIQTGSSTPLILSPLIVRRELSK